MTLGIIRANLIIRKLEKHISIPKGVSFLKVQEYPKYEYICIYVFMV